jgi:putative endonuclease
MSRDRASANRHGHVAESIALWFLRLKGYRLLARRFKTPAGEVDLVMRKGDTTVFVEVKARATSNGAIEAVSLRQSRRISGAAAFFSAQDPRAAAGFQRFDIVAVPSYLWPTHIENAFEGRF